VAPPPVSQAVAPETVTSQSVRLTPHAENVTGSTGDIYLDASQESGLYPSYGVWLASHAQNASLAMKMPTTSGSEALSVYANQSEIMRVVSNGWIRAKDAGAFFSGRTDYHESSSIAGNTVHSVHILNPRDSTGNANSMVNFFDASSDNETLSPPSVKYRAFTMGAYNQSDVNFMSVFHYHYQGGNAYHFRAYSNAEAKDTFWVKPAGGGANGQTNTSADMYVSGNVGIGTTLPSASLEIFDNNGSNPTTAAITTAGRKGGMLLLGSSALGSSGSGGAVLFGGYGPNQMFAAVKGLMTNGAGNTVGDLAFSTRNATTDAALTERVRILANGNVGVGTATPGSPCRAATLPSAAA
jgi:hypothetical protein